MRQTVKTLADEIRRRWPDHKVEVERGYASTDTKVAGTRFRRQGKGRYGARIRVWRPVRARKSATWRRDPRWEMILDHNQAETYRTTDDVRRWIDDYAAGRRPNSLNERSF